MTVQIESETHDAEVVANPLAQFRQQLKMKGLAGGLVTHHDRHLSEFIPGYAERLARLSRFTGSAGLAVVFHNEAAIFVDSRYTKQAQDQADPGFERLVLDVPQNMNPVNYVESKLSRGDCFGIDPWTISYAEREKLKAAIERAGANLVSLSENLVDGIWDDQPEPPARPILRHPLKYAGMRASVKLDNLTKGFEKSKVDALVLMPESIAWLLNIRGRDLAYNPVALVFAIVTRWGVTLFCDKHQVSPGLRKHLGESVMIEPRDLFESRLKQLGQSQYSVQLDPNRTPAAIFDLLSLNGAKIIEATDPCLEDKAIKNRAEQEGARQAHLLHDAAICELLAWIEREVSRQPALRSQSWKSRHSSPRFSAAASNIWGKHFPILWPWMRIARSRITLRLRKATLRSGLDR